MKQSYIRIQPLVNVDHHQVEDELTLLGIDPGSFSLPKMCSMTEWQIFLKCDSQPDFLLSSRAHSRWVYLCIGNASKEQPKGFFPTHDVRLRFKSGVGKNNHMLLFLTKEGWPMRDRRKVWLIATLLSKTVSFDITFLSSHLVVLVILWCYIIIFQFLLF